jgi:hypothetical protein
LGLPALNEPESLNSPPTAASAGGGLSLLGSFCVAACNAASFSAVYSPANNNKNSNSSSSSSSKQGEDKLLLGALLASQLCNLLQTEITTATAAAAANRVRTDAE